MRRGQIIKHKNFMDVACMVHTCYDYGHGYSLKIEWINQGFVESMPIGITQRIDIKKSDLNNWLVCNTPMDKCYRYSEWRSL